MNAIIRSCVAGDEAALSVLGQATFLETFAGLLGGRDILAHCASHHAPEVYRRWLEDPQSHVWLAEIEPDAAPVGYLVLSSANLPLPDLSADDLEVKRIYLLHRFQGQGLGQRLLQAALQCSVQRRARRVLLGVYAHNRQAIEFYTRQGFVPVGSRSFQVGSNRYDDLILAYTPPPE